MSATPYREAQQAAHAELARRSPQDRFYAGPRLLHLRCAPKGHHLGAVYPTSQGRMLAPIAGPKWLYPSPSVPRPRESPGILLDHPDAPGCDDPRCGAFGPAHIHLTCCSTRTVVLDACREAIRRGRPGLRV